MYQNDFPNPNLQGSALTLNTVQHSFVNWYAARKKFRRYFMSKFIMFKDACTCAMKSHEKEFTKH